MLDIQSEEFVLKMVEPEPADAVSVGPCNRVASTIFATAHAPFATAHAPVAGSRREAKSDGRSKRGRGGAAGRGAHIRRRGSGGR